MIVTMDSAGRLVIPKGLREAAGLRAGVPLEVVARDGRIEIEPAPAAVELFLKAGIGVARIGAGPEGAEPELTAADVEAVRDDLRAERGR